MDTLGEKEARKPTQEEIAAFFARHAAAARRNPSKDALWLAPLCPPDTLDALDAFLQLYRELHAWAEGKGRRDAAKILFWDAAESLRRGRAYGGRPLAQIAWLSGPKDWPARLLMRRSYSGKTFMHQGRRHYLEPQDKYVLGMMPLD